MKHFALTLAATALAIMMASAGAAAAAEKVIIHAISAEGIGKKLGTLTLSDGDSGLIVTPRLKNLPPGPHGFHVHATGDCGTAAKDGIQTAGLAAGGHFDPANTGKHEGPQGQGHRGDMPVLKVGENGKATEAVTVPHLKLADVMGHAIVIHAGGDNYSDQPKPLGGGGARIACGVAK